MMTFWIFFFMTILISLPFILVYFFAKNVGAALNTYNSLKTAKSYLDTVKRVVLICKHVATQSKVALLDLKYVQDHCEDLKSLMLVNTLEKKQYEELDEPEDRICRIFMEKRLIKLSEDFNKIADKCQMVSDKSLGKKQDIQFFNQFDNMSDNDIVKWFVPELDLSLCEDLAFVKKYIDTAGARK